MRVLRVVRSSRSASFKLALVQGEQTLQRLLGFGFPSPKHAWSRLLGCQRGRGQHGSGSGLANLASSTRLESMAATTSSSFSWDVTTIQQGAMILPSLSKFLLTLPKLFDRRPQVFDLVTAASDVVWPTSSMMKTRALPLRRRPQRSNVRLTTLLTEIDASRLRWESDHESAEG